MDPVMVELVEDELKRMSDRGELASREALREGVGMGASDLDAALDELRQRGAVTEEEPNGFRYVADGAPVEATPEPGPSLAEAEAAAGTGRAQGGHAGAASRQVTFGHEAQVTMPRAMVDLLDPAVLGGMLKAGIESSEAGETFVFEVTP